MFVIVTYDVGTKRVSKVMKICRKYLIHVQRSVFEGTITEAKTNRMKNEIMKVINTDEDQVSIYQFPSLKYSQKEIIGVDSAIGNVL